MMGRAAYQEPWRLLAIDPHLFGVPAPFPTAKAAVEAFFPYIERELGCGTRLSAITRHILGLFRGVPGARAFRRHLATEAVKSGAGMAVLSEALAGELGELNHAAMRLARYSSSQPAVLRRRRMESLPGALRVRL